jgi:hypothetical protein
LYQEKNFEQASFSAVAAKEGLIKSVTPAKAGVQSIENTGFRPSPE